MTQQEAEEWATRLTRVWRPDWVEERVFQWHFLPSNFQIGGYLTREVRFRYFDVEERLGRLEAYIISFKARTDTDTIAELKYAPSWSTAREWINPDEDLNLEEHDDRIKEFFVQWTPFFRRGCWLSGCPIEASAHEKAEWMQGFTREELEAWNLKM